MAEKLFSVDENGVLHLDGGITIQMADVTEDGQVTLNIDGPPELTISDKKTGQAWRNDGSVDGVIESSAD
jgi:hypothetical protein